MLLYIDPGTGGMLFSIIFSLIGIVYYFFRTLIIKLKYGMGKGKDGGLGDNRDEIVVFSDHKRYWNTFEPILDEFEKKECKVRFLTMSEDDPGLKKEYKYVTAEYIGSGNKAFSKLNFLNAKIVLATTPSLDVFQWKRSKNVDYYIHIPHMANDITLYRMFGIDYYDAILLSGDYQVDEVRKLEEKRGLKAKDLELVGIPYMDTMLKRLKESGPVNDSDDKNSRTVLVAPSWGESAILSRYGDKLIDAIADAGFKVIIRPHPQSYTAEKDLIEKLKNKYADDSRVEWNADNDNFDVLSKSDVLISDFSGVMFDYALVFDKPIIYADTSFDAAPYDAYWLDEEPWTFSVLPKLGIQLKEEDFGDIKNIINSCLDDPKYKQGRDQARKETWCHIGEGAKRTAEYVLKKSRELDDIKAAENEKEASYGTN